MFWSGKTYNIPVCVWLEESYPQSSPLCYVRPTREMVIVQSQHVTSNGEVLLPYLDEWKAVRLSHCCTESSVFLWCDLCLLCQGECDLISLLQMMVSLFEDLPPVCMRPYPEPAQASCECRSAPLLPVHLSSLPHYNQFICPLYSPLTSVILNMNYWISCVKSNQLFLSRNWCWNMLKCYYLLQRY